MTIIGIDPGACGGIAVLSDREEPRTYNMPETYQDIYDLLSTIIVSTDDDDVSAYMENVGHGMPGQSSKATATFARHNGHLDMALYSLKIPATMITPQKWMKHYSNSLGRSSDYDKTAWKNRLKSEAQRRFPRLKVTLKTADALLIANYGMECR